MFRIASNSKESFELRLKNLRSANIKHLKYNWRCVYKEAKNQVKRLHLRAYFEILISNVTMRRSIDKKSVREILANILAKIFYFFKNIKANKVHLDSIFLRSLVQRSMYIYSMFLTSYSIGTKMYLARKLLIQRMMKKLLMQICS